MFAHLATRAIVALRKTKLKTTRRLPSPTPHLQARSASHKSCGSPGSEKTRHRDSAAGSRSLWSVHDKARVRRGDIHRACCGRSEKLAVRPVRLPTNFYRHLHFCAGRQSHGECDYRCQRQLSAESRDYGNATFANCWSLVVVSQKIDRSVLGSRRVVSAARPMWKCIRAVSADILHFPARVLVSRQRGGTRCDFVPEPGSADLLVPRAVPRSVRKLDCGSSRLWTLLTPLKSAT